MTENLIHTMNQTDSLKFFNRGKYQIAKFHYSNKPQKKNM